MENKIENVAKIVEESGSNAIETSTRKGGIVAIIAVGVTAIVGIACAIVAKKKAKKAEAIVIQQDSTDCDGDEDSNEENQ